jgi:hypothetical protein
MRDGIATPTLTPNLPVRDSYNRGARRKRVRQGLRAWLLGAGRRCPRRPLSVGLG